MDTSPFAQPLPLSLTAEEEIEASPITTQKTIDKLVVGTRVRHDEYGIGTIQAVIPLEDRSVASILFELHGRRLLDPSLSALYPA
jgi:hypothetical protein